MPGKRQTSGWCGFYRHRLWRTPGRFRYDFKKYPPCVEIPNTYELGAAWKKVSAQGKPYLSVKLDGPTLAVPIYCALIEQKDGSYHLIWRRGEEEAEQAAA